MCGHFNWKVEPSLFICEQELQKSNNKDYTQKSESKGQFIKKKVLNKGISQVNPLKGQKVNTTITQVDKKICDKISSVQTNLATQVLSYANIVKSDNNMVKFEESTHIMESDQSIGTTVRCALERAQEESRLVVGLPSVIKTLADPEHDAVFCILAPPDIGDSATHMHETLLEAYCYENDIYVIKVDSSKKLSRILGSYDLEFCALIQNPSMATKNEPLTVAEEALVDHCEEHWDAIKQPIIGLPI